jgi:6-phospho-beta-glucosidase
VSALASPAPVALLGGGAYAARLADVIAATPELPALELRLHARDPDRLAVIAAHASARLRAAGGRHTARACLDLDLALDGAAAVVLLVRVGGLAARAHDESFPAGFGLVGDEGVGVGGAANAWRTLPVLDRIAERIAARAPASRVLNLMAPLGVTTRLLVERGLRAVGLCELPVVTEARWRARAAGARPARPDATPAGAPPPLAYAGLNHLGFFWWPGRPAEEHPVLRAAIDAGDVPPDMMRHLDAAPLHYYVDVFEPEAALALGRRRRPGRAEELAALQSELVQRFHREPGADAPELARRPTPWFDLALVPALRAALGGPAYAGALDLPAGAALDESPPEVVVEGMGRLDGTAEALDPIPPRPPAVREVLRRLAGAEDLLYRAALARDAALLADALAALPLSPRGSARDLVDCVCRPIASSTGGEVRP